MGEHDFPVMTALLAGTILIVAWQVTGFFPTLQTLEPVAWSREALARGRWDKLVLSLFAHGGLLHLGFNLLALLGFGPPMERALGPLRFAGLYLAAGVAGNLAHTAWAAPLPVVGASGSLFGLLGLLMVLTPRAWVNLFGLVPMPMLFAGALYTASVPFLLRFASNVPIAHEAHLGGMAVGIVAAFALRPRRAALVLPAAMAVFLVTFLALAYAVALDWAAVLRLGWNAFGGPLLPLVFAFLALLAAFAYLRWVHEHHEAEGLP